MQLTKICEFGCGSGDVNSVTHTGIGSLATVERGTFFCSSLTISKIGESSFSNIMLLR